MFNLKLELKNLPEQPGVYLMHDKNDTIIYVGKAKILKNRVRQYFQNSANHTPKVRAMVANIAYFEYIVTDTEIEALVLECNLIKKYKPRYNILLKDDKQYPYIKVTINEDYPRVFMTRKMVNDGAKYFGPYMGSSTIKNTLEIIQKIFHPPTCNRKFPDDMGKGRPCLNYHIKNCFAPCMGNKTKQEFRDVFFEICAFLEGNHTKLIKSLENEMKTASHNMEFERAADFRDKIRAINAIDEKQKIINAGKQTDEDIIAFTTSGNRAFVEVFFVRSGKVIGRENYRIDGVDDMSDSDIMTDFVKQFYATAVYIPKEILIEYTIDDFDLVKAWLSEKRGHGVDLQVPQRGEKKHLIEMVKKNAVIACDNFNVERAKLEEQNTVLIKLADCLGLESKLWRIESYDISNISGSENVAAMVVFENGYAKKSAYRKFKIKSFEGQDDYAAMREVIYRRFRRALDERDAVEQGKMRPDEARFLPLPDLILLDGGKGHLSVISELLSEIDADVPVFGMVKDNKHRTRALVSEKGEIEISMISNVFHFITKIQDEVHRTAITYHRQLHMKQAVKSELEEIKGVGQKRRADLLAHFKTVAKISKADLEELENVVDKRTAENVYNYFRFKEKQKGQN